MCGRPDTLIRNLPSVRGVRESAGQTLAEGLQKADNSVKFVQVTSTQEADFLGITPTI